MKNDAIHHVSGLTSGHPDFLYWLLGRKGIGSEYCVCTFILPVPTVRGLRASRLEALAANTLVLSSLGTVMDEIRGRLFCSFYPENLRTLPKQFLRCISRASTRRYMKGAQEDAGKVFVEINAEKRWKFCRVCGERIFLPVRQDSVLKYGAYESS